MEFLQGDAKELFALLLLLNVGADKAFNISLLVAHAFKPCQNVAIRVPVEFQVQLNGCPCVIFRVCL